MAKEVRIKINPKTCEIEYEVSGLPGAGCTDITNQLVQDDDVVEQKHTDEYYIPLPVPEFVETSEDSDDKED